MVARPVSSQAGEKPPPGAAPIPVSPARIAISLIAFVAIFTGLLFLPAGRLDWPAGWAYLGLMLAMIAVNWACLRAWNPELIDRRMRFGSGTKLWDKVWAIAITPVMCAVYVTAGFEARATDLGPPATHWVPGLALFAAGAALFVWSMVVNPYFEKTVRIQTDRDQRVIDSGPYAFVRHPGYTGFVGWMVATPLLLGSDWAWIPTALMVIGIVVRTALEDITLQRELDGYAAYATRVRDRLVPGLW